MTNEEAIKILKVAVIDKDKESREAVLMAINALKSEPQQGWWIEIYEMNYKCSNCGDWWSCDSDDFHVDNIDQFSYCPHCGTCMLGIKTFEGQEIKWEQ